MGYKLIAFDLDGTLLDEEKKIPEENLRALQAAAERGIVLVPATGRILEGISEEIRSLPFIRYYITINGAYVYDAVEKKVLHRGEIPLESALRLMEYMDSLPVLYDCYQDNFGLMTESMYNVVEEYFTTEPELLKLLRRMRTRVESLPETLRARGIPVQKFQMYFKPEDMGERERQFALVPQLFPELTATSSLSNNIEINSVKAGKGPALEALCASLGIAASEAVAFGDGSNDIDMLQAAGLGVAMANAGERVKAAADEVTGTNIEAGVAQIIWRILG